MFFDKLVKGDVVLDPPLDPVPADRLSLEMDYPGVGIEKDPVAGIPGPDAEVRLFEEKEEPFVKTAEGCEGALSYHNGCPDEGRDIDGKTVAGCRSPASPGQVRAAGLE